MTQPDLRLSAFVALLQHELQQVIEHLARPDARRQDEERPAAVLITPGTVRLKVPLEVALREAPVRVQPEGMVDDSYGGSDGRYQLLVRPAQADCPGCNHELSHLEVEFITCLKRS